MKISSIETTRFTEFFIRANDLGKTGFDEWVFSPGMMFQASEKWWGDRGRRDAPHEGLDVCLYRDRQSKIHYLDQTTQIPAMYAGVVAKIFDDFLGKSVIMEHLGSNEDRIIFYSIYGHTIPVAGLKTGTSFNQGDIIACLANPAKSETNIAPHLHISTGWNHRPISSDHLNWNTIGTSDTLALFDPLDIMDRPYSVLDSDFHTNRKL